MTNLKRIFLVMVVIVLLGTTAVFATNDNTIVITEEDGQTQNPIQAPTTSTENPTTNNNTNTSTYNNTNLPQTGENDYIIILTIAVFGISAVYAYKKIRDYKNI